MSPLTTKVILFPYTTLFRSGRCVGVPHHRVLCLVEDEAALALLSGLDDLVFECTLDNALNDGTDGSGLAVCLDDVIDHVVGIQALECVGEELGTLEWPDCCSHLELSGLLERGGESTGLHRIPVSHHCRVVGRDVPECIPETLVVLGDGEHGDDVTAGHVHRDRVGTP